MLIGRVERQQLVHWLTINNFAETHRGYGHVTVDELADALLGEFELFNLGMGASIDELQDVERRLSVCEMREMGYQQF